MVKINSSKSLAYGRRQKPNYHSLTGVNHTNMPLQQPSFSCASLKLEQCKAITFYECYATLANLRGQSQGFLLRA